MSDQCRDSVSDAGPALTRGFGERLPHVSMAYDAGPALRERVLFSGTDVIAGHTDARDIPASRV